MISSRALAAIIGGYALAVILVAPRVTYADSATQPPTVTVSFSGLNLDTRPGIATLFRRIQMAAGGVCEQYQPRGTLVPSAAFRACIRDAVAGAVRKVDSASLTAYYSERNDHHALNTASR